MRFLAVLLFLAATVAAAEPPAPETVIYPRAPKENVSAPAGRDPWGRAPWLVGSLALAAAGAWWLLRTRNRPGPSGHRLAIEETRSLGNRQYLVVAACDDRRLLLGVAPGRINLLCELPARKAGPE